MKQTISEVDANFGVFSRNWPAELARVTEELNTYEKLFLASYRRLVSMQGWRSHLDGSIDERALAFFLEAQNDALVSHVFARQGSWRSALKSLRSCIENICFCLYYMDHPIELELWYQGRHIVGFTTLEEYLRNHPAFHLIPNSLTGLELIHNEYSTLSRAVHASAKGFRMTADETSVRLWFADKVQVGAWSTREAHTFTGVNLVLLTTFRSDLQGTKASGLRKAISLAVPSSRHKEIKERLGVALLVP